ncbi:cell wall hydrolase [Pseudorhizobium endolithicum]|uniref:Cell wall hydrolase n=1 Tax=Pseudorhizobium endolithicum TaxID=1191678 RepID=A0ABM8PX23_9HYPH|nr:cell wall hydrolase [Pseudorhizobium endolithicum]CAD7053177.1 cell wall hydrolase [Pseudorhizobium endolithicum]
MRSKFVLSRKSRARLNAWTAPAVFGLASWLAFPTAAAHGDLSDLLSGLDASHRWRVVLTQSPAGSIHSSELSFPDMERLVPADAGMTLPNGGKVAFAGGAAEPEASPDEDRVNRKAKKGRIVAVVPMQPPKAFSAGSVLQRTSALRLPLETEEELATFAKPGKAAAQIELAEFYFRKEEKANPNLSPMIADLVTNDKADVLATAYAPAEPDFARESPFDAVLKKPEAGRFIPPIGEDDHAWAATPLPAEAFSAREQQCLASGIYFEARGESARGQAAVAQVILNRVRNPAYPKTICGVVYQNEDWRNRCQFSFACDNIRDRVRSQHHWKMAREVAMAVTAGKIWLKEVGSSTHYHAVYVRPKWAKSMKKVGRIGLHVFYRTYGGGWS